MSGCDSLARREYVSGLEGRCLDVETHPFAHLQETDDFEKIFSAWIS